MYKEECPVEHKIPLFLFVFGIVSLVKATLDVPNTKHDHKTKQSEQQGNTYYAYPVDNWQSIDSPQC